MKLLSYKLFMLIILLLSFGANAVNQINSVRIWPSPSNTRVVFDLKETANYRYFTLKSPDRLVIDLKNTNKVLNLDQVKIKGTLVKKIRYSKPIKSNTNRIVIDLAKPLANKVFSLPPTAPYGNRLVVDLTDTRVSKKTIKATPNNTKDRNIIIAIDAGHGGEDPGSIGPKRHYEKKVTYQIARKLETLIKKQKGMDAVMTRTGDYYVGLNKRSEIARSSKADLLISIHADAFTSPQPNGASVWMLSMKRANTELGRALEKREQYSELLGGAAEVIQGTENERYLAKAVLDMAQEYSISVSYEVSNEFVKELKKVTKMHKKRPQAASLAVLKSPDIPSILVETGFISNPREEKLLNQKDHQQKLAKALYKAINAYFKSNPPDGTLFASLYGRSEHIVRSGESLSVLAKRYQVSVSALKKENNLRSNTLLIGQKLTIPQT